jgi:hypothetical protein
MISRSLGALGVASLLGAPTASAQAPAGTSARAGQAAVHACSLFTDAEIARITGRRAPISFPADTATLPSGHTECHWMNLGAALTPNVTPQRFAATRKQQETAKDVKVTPVSGVGDEAYFWERSAGPDRYTGIVFRVGQYQLALSDMLPPDSVAWLKPKLVELAKFATPKLR